MPHDRMGILVHVYYITCVGIFFQGFFLDVAADERPNCGGAPLRRVHHDAHGVDDALRVLPVLLDASSKAARDSL